MANMDHITGKAVLLELASILDGLEIPFFLMQGTALGAYRDHGFTPSERDIDLGILYEHFREKTGDIARELVNRGAEIYTFSKPFSRVRTIAGALRGIRFDLVGQQKWDGKRFGTSPEIQTVARPYSIVHPAERFESPEQIEVFGRKWSVPSPIETYLLDEYGPDWRTPKEDHVSRTRIYNFVRDNGITDEDVENLSASAVTSRSLLNLNQTPVELSKIYSDNYYDYLQSQPFRKAFLEPLGKIVSELGLPVVDVACGEGYLSEYVAEGVPYLGIDGSEVAVARAREKYRGREFLVSRIEQPESIQGSFGTAVFGGVLPVLIRPDRYVDFLLSYREALGIRFAVVYDMEHLNTATLDGKFRKVVDYHATAEGMPAGFQDVKRHRKILAYDLVAET